MPWSRAESYSICFRITCWSPVFCCLAGQCAPIYLSGRSTAAVFRTRPYWAFLKAIAWVISVFIVLVSFVPGSDLLFSSAYPPQFWDIFRFSSVQPTISSVGYQVGPTVSWISRLNVSCRWVIFSFVGYCYPGSSVFCRVMGAQISGAGSPCAEIWAVVAGQTYSSLLYSL